MKPSSIGKILTLARNVRKLGKNWNPLFTGAPGVGKSEIVQAWCRENNLPFVDLRLAYYEAPDLIGFPQIQEVNGRARTVHALPEFWPDALDAPEGVILLEEPNRGTTSVMNTIMQLLTDRKVGKYTLPPGWIIAACINPEGSDCDVNTMDAALKDRFEIFKVDYDKQSFVDYMQETGWKQEIINFVSNNMWTYQLPENISGVGTKYVSPRTWSKVNAALLADIPEELQMEVFTGELGDNVGKAFFSFLHDEAPVTYQEILKNKRSALKRLNKFADPKNTRNGHLAITEADIVENGLNIEDDLLVDILEILPADKQVSLLRGLEVSRKNSDLIKNGKVDKEKQNDELLDRLCRDYPSIKENLKDVLSVKKAKKSS